MDFHKGLNYIEWYKNKITESSKERQDTLAPHKKRKRRIRTSDTSIKKTIRPREYPPLEPEDYLEVLERQSKVHYETPHEVYFKESGDNANFLYICIKFVLTLNFLQLVSLLT